MTLDVAVASDITVTFGVPVMIQAVPGAAPVNEGLKRAILGRESTSAGKSKSNSGGWHSEETVLEWPEPEIATLKGWIDGAVQRMCRLPLREKANALSLAYNGASVGGVIFSPLWVALIGWRGFPIAATIVGCVMVVVVAVLALPLPPTYFW